MAAKVLKFLHFVGSLVQENQGSDFYMGYCASLTNIEAFMRVSKLGDGDECLMLAV